MNTASLRLALRFLRSAELNGRQQVQLDQLVQNLSELLKDTDCAADQIPVASTVTTAAH